MFKWFKSLFFTKKVVSKKVELLQGYLKRSTFPNVYEDLLMIERTYSDGSKTFEEFIGSRTWRSFPELYECDYCLNDILTDLREKEMLAEDLKKKDSL